MTDADLVLDRETIESMKRAIWRDEARRTGVLEENIERTTFLRWRLVREGRTQASRGEELCSRKRRDQH